MPIKCFLPLHGTKPTQELLPGSSRGGGGEEGGVGDGQGGVLLKSVNTAHLSDKQIVLLACRAE